MTATNSLSNTGTITSSGTITNSGPVTNGPTGTITSSGLITNALSGTITNLGTITNSGPVTNSGTMTNSGRRKLPNRNTTIEIEPEIIDLEKTLAELGITREQLVDVGILIGTDFNPNGFERIGPKTAIKAIKEYGKLETVPQIQEKLEEIDYKQIRQIFLEPKVAAVSKIEFGEIDFQGITNYLSSERSFSLDRVETSLNRLKKAKERKSHTLEQWFT